MVSHGGFCVGDGLQWLATFDFYTLSVLSSSEWGSRDTVLEKI